jgi:hypothetical protein
VSQLEDAPFTQPSQQAARRQRHPGDPYTPGTDALGKGKGKARRQCVTPAFLPYSNYSTNRSLEKFFHQARIAPKPLPSELLITQNLSRPFAV